MDEAPLVRRVERLCNRPEQRDRALRGERSLLRDQLVQVDAVDEPHDDVEAPVLLACVEHLDDARVVDLGGRAPFALEPAAERRVGGEIGRQELDCTGLVEPQVAAAVHGAHAAATDHRLDPMTGEDRADQRVRSHCSPF